MHSETLPLDLPSASQPWEALLQAVLQAGASPASCAWLLPRIEQAGSLRQALARDSSGGNRFVVSPVVITADRLSDHAGSTAWLELRLAVMEILAGWPALTRQARSDRERWQLAEEYLQLAHACVAARAGSVLGRVQSEMPLAGMEAQIALSIADTFSEELQALQAPDCSHPGWPQTKVVVWLDDGDPVSSRWLSQHAGNRRILRADLLTLADGVSGPDVTLLAGADSDATAHLAARTLLDWLQQSPDQPVGVAVVDRLLTRRVRNLLDLANVRVDDRTGWRLSTTRLAGWLDCLLRGWLQRDWNTLLAGLEPQWVPLAGGAVAARLLPRWADRTARGGPSVTWDALQAEARTLAGQLPPDDRQAVENLMAALTAFDIRSRSFSGWAADLLAWLESLGCLPVLVDDAAGDALLSMLRRLARANLPVECSPSRFLMLLTSQMESVRFRPEDASSPVRFMPLQSFRLQRFQRVMVLGVARRHFMPSPPGLLPPAVAGELGLADPWLTRNQSLAALAELLHVTPHCALVHQRQAGDRPDPLLGWLHAVGLQRRQASGKDWQRGPERVTRQVPRAPVERLALAGWEQPGSLSVKAVDALAACPLQFALQHLAGLRDRQPGVHDNRLAAERGLWIHSVLESLWNHVLPDSGGLTDAHSTSQPWLDALYGAVAASWRALHPSSRHLLFQERLEFERALPELAAALATRHREGWRLSAQEQRVEKPLRFHPARPPIRLHGRLDRLEHNGAETGIVDVKTGRVEAVRRRAVQWADHPQLPLYAWMLDSATRSLAYLALRGERPAYVPLPGESAQDMADEVVRRLVEACVHLFEQAQAAVPLPGESCNWCDHAGSCRSAWWQKRALSETQPEDV